MVGIDAAAYTVSVANHEFLSDVPVGSRIAAPVSLISKTTNGACDAADASFISVAGPGIEALIIYKWTGSSHLPLDRLPRHRYRPADHAKRR